MFLHDHYVSVSERCVSMFLYDQYVSVRVRDVY